MQGEVETVKCLRLRGSLRQFHFGVNRRWQPPHGRAICTTVLHFYRGLCKEYSSECAPLHKRERQPRRRRGGGGGGMVAVAAADGRL